MSETADLDIDRGPDLEPEASPPPSEERRLSPREQIMKDIAAKSNARMEAELRLGEEYDRDAHAAGLTFDEEPPAQQEPRQEREQPVPPKVAAPAQPAPTPAPVQAQPNVRVIELDGQQVAVTDEQLVHLAKLGVVTNQALHNYERQPQWQPQAQPAAEPPRPVVDPDRIRHTVNRIQYGGEDDAAAALTQLVTDVISRVPQQQQIDPRAIVRQATQEAMAQAQLQQDTRIIQQEFADVFENPQRQFLARLNVEAIRERDMQLGQHRPHIEVYREAGHMVREAMGMPRPGTEAPTQPAHQAAPSVVSRADTLERKRLAPRMNSAADRRASTPEPPRAPSGTDLVNRMRVARGQQPLN